MPAPSPMTDEQMVALGGKLYRRLQRHLDGVERGDEGAGDDLAVVLRTLIENQNRGNRAIFRLAEIARVELPRVLVSGAPERKPPGRLVLAFGHLPVVPGQQVLGQGHSSRSLGFREWTEAHSLLAPQSQQRAALSWGRFAGLVGNTSGAHLSQEYNDLLVTSDLFGSAGFSLQNYLLRQVGWQVEQVLGDVMLRAGVVVPLPTRKLDRWPAAAVWGWFSDQPGADLKCALAVNVSGPHGEPVELIAFHLRGNSHRVWHDGKAIRLEVSGPLPAAGPVPAT